MISEYSIRLRFGSQEQCTLRRTFMDILGKDVQKSSPDRWLCCIFDGHPENLSRQDLQPLGFAH